MCHSEKNRNDRLRRQTQDITDRVAFIVQYFLRAERLCHVLCSLQHVIDDEYLTRIFPMPPLLAFKQPSNLKQTIVHSKLPSLQDSIDYNTTKPCHGNICKICQIFDMDTTITCGNITHHAQGRYSCDLANVVYLIRCRQECPEAWYIGDTMQTLHQRMNGHRTTVARHFSGQGHSASDLR
eukprot:g48189.t1